MLIKISQEIFYGKNFIGQVQKTKKLFWPFEIPMKNGGAAGAVSTIRKFFNFQSMLATINNVNLIYVDDVAIKISEKWVFRLQHSSPTSIINICHQHSCASIFIANEIVLRFLNYHKELRRSAIGSFNVQVITQKAAEEGYMGPKGSF